MRGIKVIVYFREVRRKIKHIQNNSKTKVLIAQVIYVSIAAC
jgi:hypothetical protein